MTPVCFHNGFISVNLQLQFQSGVHFLFCCCYTCCGIVFLCQVSTSLSLHPDRLHCCTEPLLQYVSLMTSWLRKWVWTNAVECQKHKDPSQVNSDAPPTYVFLQIIYIHTPTFMLKLQLLSCSHWIFFHVCLSCSLVFTGMSAFFTWHTTDLIWDMLTALVQLLNMRRWYLIQQPLWAHSWATIPSDTPTH